MITSRLSSLASEEGQTLVTMADLDTVYVVTEVDETDIGKVEIGQPATITVEAYPDTPFQGEVLKIAPQGQAIQNVTTFEVTSELKNVKATASSQGMTRGGGRWQGGGERPDFANMTQEQRERFRAMRQQRQAENGGSGETPRPAREETAAQPTQDQPVAQVEEEPEADDFGGLFGGFFQEAPAVEAPIQPESAETEDTKIPFLKPGMNATVQISAINKTGILTLPPEAVLDMRGRKMVRMVGADGQPGRPQPIVTGVSSFDKIEVISGLAEGDAVAIGGFTSGGRGGEDWRRRMMQNPASTMRRMTGGGGRGR